jgi:CIC family chloride channel protein
MPEVMGIGYDTVNLSFSGELGLGLLAGLVIAKLLATVIGIGLGLPGGLIGPTLFIGAVAGSLMGLFGISLMPGENASPGMYAMIGMGAMMAAVLNAPLAALLAIVELTANPNIILPGMLCVIAANLTSSYGCKQPSVFLAQLRARNLDYRNDPFSQALRALGVTAMMDTLFIEHGRLLARDAAEQLLDNKPNWIVIAAEEGKEPVALPSLDLRRYIEAEDNDSAEDIDLLAIPAKRLQLGGIAYHASLQEAYEAIEDSAAEAVYVWRHKHGAGKIIAGILTRETILAARHRND